MVKISGLLMVMTAALAATLLLGANVANAKGAECPASGIMRDSTLISSSSNQAGQVASHIVWFQLCHPLKAGTDEGVAPPLSRIALIWDSGQNPVNRIWEKGFFLYNDSYEEITLQVAGDSNSWKAEREISGGNCNFPYRGHGVAVDFTKDNLGSSLPASLESPLTMQFEIPVTAGMINPVEQGKYSWTVVTYYDHGGFFHTHFERLSSTILKVGGAEVSLAVPGQWSRFRVTAESEEELTITGAGFKPLTPVQSVKIAGREVELDRRILADERGRLAFNIVTIWLSYEIVVVPVVVQVGGIEAGGEIVLIPRYRGMQDPNYYTEVHYALRKLEDNLVSVFQLDEYEKCWTFYDMETPDDGEMKVLVTGETYWILIKEPVEVVLNYTTHTLTCTPEGNCWNQIVW